MSERPFSTWAATMRAQTALAIGIIFGFAVLSAAFFGMDEVSLVLIVTTLSGSMVVLFGDQKRRSGSGCCKRSEDLTKDLARETAG